MGKKKKRIVMIGPVYPYKGGIAHYTGLLCRTLRKEHQVYMMSYKMQYPKILYKKEQRDYSNDTFRIDKTDYQINTANPLNWIRSANIIKKQKPDLVLIQWWHPYFAPCYFIMCSLLKNYPTLFLCHNVFPHERFPFDRMLTRMVLKKGNYFIVQSKQDEDDLRSVMKDARYIRTVHPTYNAFRLRGISKAEGRAELKLKEQEKVLLFFGFVREYKGLKHLLKAMPKIADKVEGVRLYVVGDFGSDKGDYLKLIEDLKIKKYIRLVDGYVPDQEVEKYFAAADLVVLPYESATQSGIAQIAYGFEKPVVVTDVGGLPEIVADGRTGYIAKSKNSDDIADKIIRFFEEGDSERMQNAIREEADKYSWETFVKKIHELLEWR